MPELPRVNSDGTFPFQEGVLYIPLLVSLVSLTLLACRAVLRLVRRYRVKPAKAVSSEAPVGGRDSGTVGSYYQPMDYQIRIWNALRLIGVLCLLVLGLWSQCTLDGNGIRVSNQLGYVLTYVYSTLLAFVTVRSRGIHADTTSKHLSTILFSAWAVCAYRDILPLATYGGVPTDASEGIVLWLKLGLLTFTGVLVPLVVPRRYRPLDPSDPQKEINPEQIASILSMAFYSWLDRYILLGYRLPHLPFEELPPIADYDMAKNLVKKSFSHLDPTLTNSRRHLFLGILRVFWKEWALIAVLYLIQVATTFAIPVGIYNLLDYLSGSATGHIRPIVWVLWLAISSILGAVVLHWFRFVATRMAIQTQAILTQLIFNHTLRSRIQTEHRPSPGTSGGKAEPGSGSANFVGKLTNLITTDLSTVIDGREFLNVVIYIPLQTAVCMWFLYKILGWSAFVGLVVILLVSPLPGYMGRKIRAVQAERMKRTDARVQSVTEVLNVIRIIKIFAWESKVNNQIADKRQDELSYLMKLRLLELLNRLVNFVVPPLTMIATFATYTMVMKRELTAPRVFSSMVIFDILQTNLRLLFGTIPIVTQAYVSLDRVNDFMHKTELLEPSATEDSELVDGVEQNIGIRDACFTWNVPQIDITNSEPRSTFVLRVDEELKFVPGMVNVVAGPSGSGKTSLLMALLGEMHYNPTSTRSYLRLPRSGGVAYAAQESWVLSGTIRENILFGSDFNDARYNETIEQCALRRDLDLFDAGDSTEVGERGITLSGGQKARITLARAVYSSARILLLDDVFAALDIRTGKHIVDKCLKGNLLKDRTVILATHHLNLVYPALGYVVTLTANGRIESQGPPQTLAPLISQLTELVQQNDSAYDVHGPGDDPLPIKPSPEAGKLTVAEEISQGRVGWSALKLYFTSLGGNAPAAFWFTFLGGMLATALIQTAQAWYLGYWARQYKLRDPQEVNVAKYLAVYSAMLGAVVLTYMAAFVAFMYGALRASRILHQSLVQSVLGSTVRWLDKTPTSRIIARCTQDIQMIDSTIALCLCGFTERTIFMFIKFAAIIVVSPRLIVAGILVCSLGLWLSQVYIKAQLSVQRETSNARAPVLSHFAATVAGLVSIRAYGAQEAFIQEAYRRIDRYTRGARTTNNINRWIAIRVESIAGLSAAALAAYLVYWKDTSASDTGFSLTMAVGFSGMILWWVRQLNDFEVSANSLERIQQYLQIDHEPKPTSNGMPPAYWPASGELVVKSLSAKYSEDGPNVLHDVSFNVKSGERVGIVGRTGSGKSTLTLALLRCVPTSGEVWYDGIRTDTLNLDALRTSITMIPQSPELLSGTIRQNLDPFAQYSDAELNNALRAAGAFSAPSTADGPLSSEDRNGRVTLDAPVSSGGLNYSVGQRQILALARAIVRKSKVLILDEATSSIDHVTDTTIQTSLRNRLDKDVTLLIVAHRLQTVMDADKIMVLDAGHIVEFGPPSELLQREGGALRGLVEQSSDRDQLYAMARGISE